MLHAERDKSQLLLNPPGGKFEAALTKLVKL